MDKYRTEALQRAYDRYANKKFAGTVIVFTGIETERIKLCKEKYWESDGDRKGTN